MQLPIVVGVRRSFLLDLLVGAVAGCASVALINFPVASPLRLVLLLLVWGLAGLAWRALAPIFSALRLTGDGRIAARYRRGDGAFEVFLAQPGATVHPLLVVFRLRRDNEERHLMLARDSMSSQDFRRLRVFLRWRADFNSSGDDA